MTLQSIIKSKIKENKWLTVEQYMEFALYHSEYGYYMKQQLKIGKNGDFYTSSSVSDVFGSVWADVFVSSIKEHNLDPIIVEFGGGNGNFAKHVLQAWDRNDKTSPLTYIIVEKSPFHREILKNQLKPYSVTIVCSLEEISKDYLTFKGIIFANEVLDAFPLRIFQNKEDCWFEKVVMYDELNDSFFFTYLRLEDECITKTLTDKFSKRPSNFDLELSFQMVDWLEKIYKWSNEGTLLFFVDYGYKGEQWSMDRLKLGSIRGYYRHQMENNPLSYPGEMDITYHVDWDLVKNTAEKCDIETIAFHTQGDFLLKEGLLNFLTDSIQTLDPFSKEHRRNRAIRSFLLDSSLSNGFQVIQQKKRSVI